MRRSLSSSSRPVRVAWARALAALAIAVAALVPSASGVLAGPVAPALSECAPTVSCARFTITLGGAGSGLAESSDITTGVPDGHIDCHLTNGQQTGTCTYLYSWPLGQATYNIHLDAAPSMGNVVCFTNKTCLAEGYSTPLPFTLQSGTPTTYEIDFKPALRTLTVEAVFEAGPAASHVVKATNIESIDCPPTCTWQYDYGTKVDLAAHSPDGFAFVGGFGACAGLSDTCTVTMTDDVSAGFTFIPYTLVTPSPKATSGPQKTSSAVGGSTASAVASATAGPSGAVSTESAGPFSAAPATTSPSGASPAAATGPDPLVIGLVGVIAVLLAVIGIGLLVATRRRAA